MKKFTSIQILALALIFLLSTQAFAIVVPKGGSFAKAHTLNIQTLSGNTNVVTWAGSAATFMYFNNVSTPPTQVEAGSSVVAALDAAGVAWENVSTFNFTSGGLTATGDTANDGTNLVTFNVSATNSAAVGGALAVALTIFNSSLQVVDCDIVFSSAVTFSTLGTASNYDIQSVATHEFGHAYGLNHSAICSATMFPFTSTGALNQRTLTTDDIAGINGIYLTVPNFWTTGAITGTVTKSSTGIYGAHVVARNVATGVSYASAMTMPAYTETPSMTSIPDGFYKITGLPPGPYQVYAEPLDGPVGDTNILSSFFMTGKDTSFQTTFLGGNANPTIVRVLPATLTPNVDFAVTATAQSINFAGVGEPAGATSGFSFNSSGFDIQAGTSTFIAVVGPGFDTFADTAFTMSGNGITFGPASTNSGTAGGNGFKVFPVTIAANAPTGPHDITLDTGTEIAVYAGVINITDPASPAANSYNYGTGSIGSAGTPTLTAPSNPTVPNMSFSLDVSNGAVGETAYYFASAYPDYIDNGLGLIQWINWPGARLLSGQSFTASFDLFGDASLSMPIPMIPGLAGFRMYVQAVLTDSLAAMGVSTSPALVLEFQ